VDSTGEALHQYMADTSNTDLAKTLQRDVHTLKGGARMAEIGPIADLSHELEELFERVAEGRLELGEDTGELLLQCHDALARMVEQVSAFKPCEDASELSRRVHAVISGKPAEAQEPEPETESGSPEAPDNELSTLFLDEARELKVRCSNPSPNGKQTLNRATPSIVCGKSCTLSKAVRTCPN